jgi:hypothetical protein
MTNTSTESTRKKTTPRAEAANARRFNPSAELRKLSGKSVNDDAGKKTAVTACFCYDEIKTTKTSSRPDPDY